MQYGLMNNGGQWEIPEKVFPSMPCSIYREGQLDWMFYYNIEIYSLEDINKLVEFFGGKLSIELDPTTVNLYVICVKENFNIEPVLEEEIPF